MTKSVDINDIIGKKFGRLTVKYVIKRGSYYYYNCHCDCGNDIVVLRGNLINGHTNSCGCIKVERAVAFGRSRKKENKEICTFCGEKPVYAKGLCAACYARYMRNGSPEYIVRNITKLKKAAEKENAIKRRNAFIAQFNPSTDKGKLFLKEYIDGSTLAQIGEKYGLTKMGVKYYMQK